MAPGDISNFREEYGIKSLLKNHVDTHPLVQFKKWFTEAITAGVPEPNAMTLATVNADGCPRVRIVLMKDIGQDGLTFFTNYQSQKSQDILNNPHAALNFFWQPLERQVRMVGEATPLPAEESDSYFQSRPRGSQIGAWVSPQSQEIPNRQYLEDELQKYAQKFDNHPIPRPEYWGGFLLKPYQVEFWQGGADRLHDRLEYNLQAGNWTLRRIAP